MPNTTYVSQLTERMTRNDGSSGHEPPNPFACQLRNVDYTIDDARLGTCCPLDDDRYATQPSRSLEKLDELSLELLSEILLGLDIPILIGFRRVNRRAMAVVSSSLQYRKTIEQCPDVLLLWRIVDVFSFVRVIIGIVLIRLVEGYVLALTLGRTDCLRRCCDRH